MRAFVATIVAAMLATPCAVLAAMPALQFLLGEPHAALGDPSTPEFWVSIPSVLLLLSGGGMIFALPAAVLNLVVVEVFARYVGDSWTISAMSGAVIGLAVHFVMFGALLPGPFVDAASMGGMIVTGIAMGLLYWSIAVRPRRRLRMGQGISNSGKIPHGSVK